MAKVVVVTSGKGGVGKTTSTAALGAAIAQTGEKVVVVDFDVGLRNLDLVMGAERRVVYDSSTSSRESRGCRRRSSATSAWRLCGCCPPRRPATRTR